MTRSLAKAHLPSRPLSKDEKQETRRRGRRTGVVLLKLKTAHLGDVLEGRPRPATVATRIALLSGRRDIRATVRAVNDLLRREDMETLTSDSPGGFDGSDSAERPARAAHLGVRHAAAQCIIVPTDRERG